MSGPTFDSIDAVTKTLGTDSAWSSPPAGLDRLADEARSLAQLAYTDGDEVHRRRAEVTLYRLHSHSRYHAPAELAPHVLWSVLARAKLDHLWRGIDAPREMTSEALRERLGVLLDELGAFNHPLHDEFGRSGVHGQPFREWTQAWFATSRGFTRHVTGLALRCAAEDQRSIVHSLGEEFEGPRHYDLRKEFVSSIGVEVTERASEETDLTAAFGLSNLRCCLASLPDATYGLGSMWSIEANWVRETGRLIEALNRSGIPLAGLRYFSLHAAVDAEHAAEWMDLLCEPRRSGEQRSRAYLGAVAQLRARRDLYDALLACAK